MSPICLLYVCLNIGRCHFSGVDRVESEPSGLALSTQFTPDESTVWIDEVGGQSRPTTFRFHGTYFGPHVLDTQKKLLQNLVVSPGWLLGRNKT